MYLIYKNYAAAILKFKINTIKLNTIGVDTTINIVSEYDFYETPLKK